MRLLSTIFTFAIILIGICECASAQRGGNTPRGWFDSAPSNTFWVDVGGAVFDRPEIDNRTILLQDSVTNQIFLTLGDVADVNTSFGANVALGGTNHWCGIWDAEASIVNWDSATSFSSPNLTSPFFDNAAINFASVETNSDLTSLEFNFKRPITRGLTLLAGPRYFRLEEQIDFTANAFMMGVNIGTQNEIRTTNSMIGAQIGAELRQQVSQSVFIRTHIKFAGFANRIEFSDQFSDTLGNSTVDERDGTAAAFIGETGGRLIWDIIPGALQTYTGYEATWLGLGNDEAGVTAAPDANFYHQILFGVTLSR